MSIKEVKLHIGQSLMQFMCRKISCLEQKYKHGNSLDDNKTQVSDIKNKKLGAVLL